MPAHTSLARSRALYTGETLTSAKSGVARNRSLGLDDCLPAQRAFRFLLALGYLNNDPRAYEGPAGWHVAVLSAYTVTFSPRWNRLVIIADVPDNVTRRLLRGPVGGSGLPGLRFLEHRGSSYVLRHLPTGAELVITGNASGRPEGRLSEPHFDALSTAVPVTEAEAGQLHGVPEATEDAQRLLAGVLTRVTARDPHRSWAIGNWFYDPLTRPGWLDMNHRQYRTLLGRGDHWVLSWGAIPYESDLVAALTDPVVGIAGAGRERDSGDTVVTLGGATLRLRPEGRDS
ncbi:hypothetical protein ACFWGM_36865 [Streptomyces roseolus]|uniref:hypothetical protein n=2 Tax=Streptomyces TaxID=1883 RepID=UPI00362522D0